MYAQLKNYNEIYQSQSVPCTQFPLTVFVNEKGLWTTFHTSPRHFLIKHIEKTKTKNGNE